MAKLNNGQADKVFNFGIASWQCFALAYLTMHVQLSARRDLAILDFRFQIISGNVNSNDTSTQHCQYYIGLVQTSNFSCIANMINICHI